MGIESNSNHFKTLVDHPASIIPAVTSLTGWAAALAAIVALIDAAVPSGTIRLWHGTIGNIPAGNVLCDGNSGTPNLLTRFVQGVATAGTDPGAVGGAATHTLVEAEIPAHVHTYLEPQTMNNRGLDSYANVNARSSQNTGSTGGSGAHQNEPLFYDVAFIMKT